ncbi:MAG: 2,3-bisphosphoglycerate-dependent phosphoglycerate mutase [Acidimicrobiia bacterium]|nr:2,3-bisphosphoglycerate-dependent phosphoglycerate mutase [Acidimicrobiia bacterium]
MTATLILVRHGQSTWNLQNRFTGWYDCPLSPQGRAEAVAAGRALAAAGIHPDVAHTSLQTRAIDTCTLALAEVGCEDIPIRRHWRLNERHYGDLTGLDKAETADRHGAAQVRLWRRSYATEPPPIRPDNPWNPAADPRYAHLAPDEMPLGESLRDVLVRLLPYWDRCITADLHSHPCVLIAAHGNSLRALVKHLDGIADEAITGVEIPTGVPIRYEIGSDGRPTRRLALADRFVADGATDG